MLSSSAVYHVHNYALRTLPLGMLFISFALTSLECWHAILAFQYPLKVSGGMLNTFHMNMVHPHFFAYLCAIQPDPFAYPYLDRGKCGIDIRTTGLYLQSDSMRGAHCSGSTLDGAGADELMSKPEDNAKAPPAGRDVPGFGTEMKEIFALALPG